MSDSPAFRSPCISQEEPILQKLLLIRDGLLLLKQDKTKYVKSQDVVHYYDQILEQVDALNKIRAHCDNRNEKNRCMVGPNSATGPPIRALADNDRDVVDTVLDDCFQLISLFFLTIGRNSEAPAAWSITSTIKRLLDHLREAGFFTSKDLKGITIQLESIRETVDRGKDIHSPHILTLLDARITVCQSTLAELQQSLSTLSPELMTTHEKLVSILRTLSGCNMKANVPIICYLQAHQLLTFLEQFPMAEVRDLQRQLLDIEKSLDRPSHTLVPSDQSATDRYVDALTHITYDKNSTKGGREVVLDLLSRCLLWSEISMEKKGKIDERFRDIFENLISIRNQLEKLSLTQAWSLRETDLYSYQRRLDRVDEARVDGNFVDANGVSAELYEQRGLLYLLRKSYSMIYFMITSSEPVSEALLPIYNQLMTLKRCLKEVQRSGGVSSPREIYPYSMKLNSIDNMRQDGKFIVNGDIPEGQGNVTELLSECFDLTYELRLEAEAKEGDDSENEKDTDSGVHLDEKSDKDEMKMEVLGEGVAAVSIETN